MECFVLSMLLLLLDGTLGGELDLDPDGTRDKFMILEEHIDPDTRITLHAYPGKVPKMSELKDGADVFRQHQPGANKNNETISLESVKYPGLYLSASIDKGVRVMNLTTPEEMDMASFYQNHKVRMNRDIYRLYGHEYNFLCSSLMPPYESFVGLDDDSKEFAKACSYENKPIDQADLDEANKGEDNLEAYTQILLPSSSQQQSIGVVAIKDERIRVGMPANVFKIIQPSLSAIERSVSFQYENDTDYFLVRQARDIYLQRRNQSELFAQAATFSIEQLIDDPGLYYIHPYPNKDYALGHIHVPPFYVRAFLNNNTNEFDIDSTWKLQASHILSDEPHFNIFGHPGLADKAPLATVPHDSTATALDSENFDPLVHDEILRLIANPKEELSYDEALKKAVMGKIDFTLLKNPSAVWHALVKGHVEHMLLNKVTVEKMAGMQYENALKEIGGKETEAKFTELHAPFNDWSTCSSTCGEGTQYRTSPCTVDYFGCTPVQEWQQCHAAPCEVNVMLPVATPAPPVHQCPSQCMANCNPQSCQMSCCAPSMKKNVVPNVHHSTIRLRNIIREIKKRHRRKRLKRKHRFAHTQ